MTNMVATDHSKIEIQIVEDSMVQAEVLRKTLTKRGYRVTVAKNGVEGLEMVKNQKPTLIISDINMPEMDGFQMCKEIKQDEVLKDIPIILLTSLSEPEDIIRGLECKADNFVTKPYDEQYLLTRIDQILTNLELRKSRRLNIGVEMYFGGKKHVINSEQYQILDLLFSTFEAAIQKNHELTKTQRELVTFNARLEDKVMERTKELQATEEQLKYLAHYDSMTNLPNRILFLDRLNQALARAPWNKRLVAVLFIDLDHFKRINDTLGHHMGDLLLRGVAERLSQCIRDGDTVGRLGGDEFTVTLADIAHSQDIPKVIQKITDVFSQPFQLGNQDLFVTPSIGISLYPKDGNDAETLLKKADAAMYLVKENGRNNCQFYSPDLSTKGLERLTLENNLRHALKRNEMLVYYYQPQVDLQTGQIIGVEALLRWQHPDLGMVPMAKMIPLAEDTGLIIPIGEWVLRTACAQNKEWQAAGLPPIRMAVNLSPRQFRQQNLVEMVEGVLKETGLNPKFLEFELTEGTMQNAEPAITYLQNLNSMGIHIAIDDFGTGYSSLGRLKKLPIDKLKIDQSFVGDILTDTDDRLIVEAIIKLAHSLSLKVIAEAVETKDQLEILHTNQCDEIQGNLFSPPLPAKEVTRLLADQRQLLLPAGPDKK